MAPSTIVHATDHYWTEACTAAMTTASATREYDPDSRALFQLHSGICPFPYDRFIDSCVGAAS